MPLRPKERLAMALELALPMPPPLVPISAATPIAFKDDGRGVNAGPVARPHRVVGKGAFAARHMGRESLLYEAMSTPRRHHFVPQILLRRFTERGGRRFLFDKRRCAAGMFSTM
jgi:hypothetical protein